MKKCLGVSAIVVLTLFVGSMFAPCHAQTPAPSDTPTFYRLVPGTYVNGWPRFTIHFPRDWVERPLAGGVFFMASSPGSKRREGVAVAGGPIPLALERYVDFQVPYFKRQATDVTVVSDKPSRLRDGTPAQELEMKFVMNSLPVNWLGVATKKGDFFVSVNVFTGEGTIGESLRMISYSLEYESGHDEPVKVPSDIQEFIDKHANDIVSHDLAHVMANYSDRFLNTGLRKGQMEGFWKQSIGSFTSVKGIVTDFAAEGDKVYLAGYWATNHGRISIPEIAIIKENGEWKWYGNQREAAP